MKQFSKEEQVRFWSHFSGIFKGYHTAPIIVNSVYKYIGTTILDAGAGNGDLKRTLKKFFPKANITAIDLAPHSKDVKEGDCTKLDFADSTFDTYFATDVIEHLNDNDLIACLKEARRVLKDDGYAIIATLNDEEIGEGDVICPECGVRFHSSGHCQNFTQAKIRKLLSKYGFDPVSIRPLNLIIMSKLKPVTTVFYALRLNRLIPWKKLNSDLLIIARAKQ